MADNWLGSFAVALGFEVNTAQLNTAKKSIVDYEAAVKAAEKRIEDARWAGAKSEQEIAKLTRETNLKEAKDALAAAQQREKAEAEQLKKREQHAKEFVSAWNRMALAATAAATAISYAVTTVTRSFDNLGFVSQRTGASVQALNSLSYAFKQVGGTSDQAVGAVESFAKALRENSGVKSYVQSLGVDMSADTAQQLLQTVEKLNAHRYDVGFREAGLAGISEENYNLISRQLAQIKAYRAEYDGMTKSLGVNSKDATDASMAFQRSLNRLQATASALTDKLLVSLAPALKAIVDRFQDWIRSNPEKVERIMDGISRAVVWVSEKIGALVQSFTGSSGDEFMKRWEAFGTRVRQFADNIERIANGIEKIARFLSWASGTKTVLGDPQRTADILNQMRAERESGVSFDAQRERKDPDAGLSGLARRAWRATKRALGGGAAEAHTGGGGSAGAPAESDEVVTTHGHRWKPGSNTAAGRERVASWLQFFQAPIKEGGLGTDTETARAMVAMMQGESDASLRPDAKGDPRNGVPTAFGTAQWRLERFEALKAMAARMKTEWTDVGAQQQHFRNEVLNGKYRGVWNRILSAPTGEQKLRAGIEGFEVPKYPGKAYDFRVHYLHALRRAPSPAVAANSGIVVPAPGPAQSTAPNMTPGGFDVNNIDPRNLMKVDPATSPAVMNSTTSSSRSLTQNNTFKVDITGSQTPQEHARAFTKSADGLYALALRNAQSATV